MKYSISSCFLALFVTLSTVGQEIQVVDSLAIDAAMSDDVLNAEVNNENTVDKEPFTPFKVDGVASVVGDYVILESDIDKFFIEIKNQGQSVENITRCQVLGNLMETKLLTHHAIQDSIEVNEGRVNSEVSQLIARFTQQLGSEEKVIAFYKKDNMADLRAELYEIRKENILAQKMNAKIVEEVDVTPDEIRKFYNSIPKDELPLIGVELEIAQIVIEPEPTEEAIQEVKDRLNTFRADILENGASFATKAVLYTDDGGSRGEGGRMVVDRKSRLVPEFREVIFSLQEGEISEPFETEYGWHIATLERIRGDQLEIRHILLIPEISKTQEDKARDEINLIRKRILDGELAFGEAAQEFSDEKETKFEGGVLTNPNDYGKRFELTKVDTELYTKISNLNDGEVSLVFNDPSRTGKTRYKILTVDNREDEHVADFVKDYVKIKNLALEKKQIEAIQKWQKEKILDTYIKINGDNRECAFQSNWLKE